MPIVLKKKETTLPAIPCEVDYSRIEQIIQKQIPKVDLSALKPKPQRHYHTLDLKSTKVLVIICCYVTVIKWVFDL